MLLNELDNYITQELGVTLKEYRYINIGGKVVYIEGQGGIVNLSKEEISFSSNKSPTIAEIFMAASHKISSSSTGRKITPAAKIPKAPTPDFNTLMQLCTVV